MEGDDREGVVIDYLEKQDTHYTVLKKHLLENHPENIGTKQEVWELNIVCLCFPKRDRNIIRQQVVM